ncbi:MAG TPA: carboxypeptidase-like regulatory domain-containing protein [Terracidiphilus sp.]|nr:carboxypeptidase-like regulatory domain-containing protein [Terracidiphilus sp.]
MMAGLAKASCVNNKALRRILLGVVMTMLLSAAGTCSAQATQAERELDAPHQPEITVRLTGVVREAATSQPVPHALVTLEGASLQGALTDARGRFEFEGAPAGTTVMHVRKPGYRSATGEGDESDYDVRLDEHTGDLKLELRKAGSLEGLVQLSTEDPAANFVVELLRRTVVDGRVSWSTAQAKRTDDQGFYHFEHLEPGEYTTVTQAHLENSPGMGRLDAAQALRVKLNGYPVTYFPNVQSLAAAQSIRISPGERARADLSLTMEPFYPTRFNLIGPDGKDFHPDMTSDAAKNGAPVAVEILDSKYQHTLYAGFYETGDGMVAANLPDGDYVLELFVGAKTAGAAMGDSKADYVFGLMPFSVAGSGRMNGPVTLQPQMSRPLSVHFTQDAEGHAGGGNAAANVNAWLTPAGSGYEAAASRINAVHRGDVIELMYSPLQPKWLHLQTRERFCAGVVRAGGVNLAREPLVNDPFGTNPPADLELRTDCATLRVVLSTADKSATGVVESYRVYVVPDFDTLVEARSAIVTTVDVEGVELSGLTPGSYHVYAVAPTVELPYRDAAAMEQLGVTGQEVVLGPKASSSLVIQIPVRP